MFERNSSVEYRAIPGFPGYEAGDDGSVWSYWSTSGRLRLSPRSLKQTTQTGQRGPRYFRAPYKRVGLTIAGRLVSMHVHRLVLLAFVGPCPPGMETRHLDDNPENNRRINLEWATKQRNGLDRRAAGRSKGQRNGRAKLSTEDVAVIRLRLAAGETLRAIATDYEVSFGLIGHIKRGRNWTHTGAGLTPPPPSA